MYYRENEKSIMTIGDSVYSSLRNNIIELNIKPGEMISIKDICTQLNVSRSPVRDALIKLEKEGLITSMPQRGTMISKIDLNRVSEERYLRECLEEKTMMLFLKCHKPEDIDRLKEIVKKQKESIADEDYRKSLQYDDEFHKIFFDATNKKLCWQTLQSTSGHYRRIRLLTMGDKNIVGSVIQQHEDIIECIVLQDAKRLEKLLRLHLTKLDTEELDLLEKYPELFEIGFKPEASNDLLQQDFYKMLK
ncbi:MAG: GntR family transcriptional regulator [Clostridia bacterium]|jgi:DNA-binding GntR family transcriptional regulator|nr:GntR family transcriptional regulator [Clostridia bacterium]